MEIEKMNISRKTALSLEEMGFKSLTEVQEKAIPFVLEGREIICRSKTGTGKTAVFGIGLVELMIQHKIRNGGKGLVIVPTRELAMQVTDELWKIGKNNYIRSTAVYGGVSIDAQYERLAKGVQIVVATPGRLLDMIERRYIDPKSFGMVVLDEADVMLDMGFIEDIDRVLSMIPNPQVLLFSATIDDKVLEISEKYMHNPEYISMSEMEKPIEIYEEIIDVEKKEKFGALLDLLFTHRNKKVLIFMNTKRGADLITEKLRMKRFFVNSLHGDLTQKQREYVMGDFKRGKLQMLVATDVAARGIHVDNVDIVINYDLAKTAKQHLHRIGRTGRMNQKGMAITLNVVGFGARDEGHVPVAKRMKYEYRGGKSEGKDEGRHHSGNSNEDSKEKSGEEKHRPQRRATYTPVQYVSPSDRMPVSEE